LDLWNRPGTAVIAPVAGDELSVRRHAGLDKTGPSQFFSIRNATFTGQEGSRILVPNNMQNFHLCPGGVCVIKPSIQIGCFFYA
jgi:hypothetical protein